MSAHDCGCECDCNTADLSAICSDHSPVDARTFAAYRRRDVGPHRWSGVTFEGGLQFGSDKGRTDDGRNRALRATMCRKTANTELGGATEDLDRIWHVIEPY